LLKEHCEGIEIIHEIDENNFIFYTNHQYGDSLGGLAHNNIIIDLIKLEGNTKNDIDSKLKELTEEKDYDDDYFGVNRMEKSKTIDKNEEKKVKLTCKCNYIFEYNRGFPSFYGYVIIKSKFFVVIIDNYINIFDLLNGKQLKRYEILIDGEDNIYKADMYIEKWNNNEDNEFLLFDNGNIVLFELNEEQNKEIKLKIISQSYFPDIKNIEKLSEEHNKFYEILYLENKKMINPSGSNQMDNNIDNNKNRFCISIFQ